MKKTILLLAAFAFLSCNNDDIIINNDDDNNGNAKKEYLVTNVYSGRDNNFKLIRTYSYNNNNKPIKIEYNNDLKSSANYTYDSSGTLVEIIKSPLYLDDFGEELGYIKTSFEYTTPNNFIAYTRMFKSDSTPLGNGGYVKYIVEGKFIKNIKDYHKDESDYHSQIIYSHDKENKLTSSTLDYNSTNNARWESTITDWEDNKKVGVSAFEMRSHNLDYFPNYYVSTKHPKKLTHKYSKGGSTILRTYSYEYDDNNNTTIINQFVENSDGNTNPGLSYKLDYAQTK